MNQLILNTFLGVALVLGYLQISNVNTPNKQELTQIIYSKKITGKTVIVVDFTQSIEQKRLYIVNRTTNAVIYSTYVSHGSGSGWGNYPTKFSNKSGTHASSLGVYKLLNTYTGNNGLSIKIQGLDPGYNTNAYSRVIVIHSASYIGKGKKGKSFGCFVVPKGEVEKILNLIGTNAELIAYYPEPNLWNKYK